MFAKNAIRSIVLLVGMLTLTFSASASPQTQDALNTAAIDAYIKNHMAEHQIPGLALIIVHNDVIVYTQGYGVADSGGTPVTPSTPFILASTSKSFTALAIMQLVEAGEIELDAPVQIYLPWFTMADPEKAALITVRHLLAHTSGLSGPVSDKDLVNPDVSEAALETHIRELADYDLPRLPGESHEYNNTGYDILGLIVQTVSRQSYEDYIEAHLFSPLEMTDSYTSKFEAQENGLAVGHTYFFGNPRVSADAPYPRRKLPSGGLISSAEDLGHYLIAQLNGGHYMEGQVLSRENIALMHQPAVKTLEKGISYAFGWRTNLVDGEPSVRHGGDSPSSHSNIAFSPARGWGVAVVMNVFGFPQSAALNEPINEVMRMASGYEAGQPEDDLAAVFYILWGIAIIAAILNLLLWALSYRRWQREGSLPRLWRYLLLPLAINLGFLWFLFIGFPSSMDSDYSVMFVYLPDTSLIFMVCAGVILLATFFRLGLYLRSRKAS
ncbi:serine hydrolase domain-containing protein [Chloroflexota bacterium]